MKKTIAAIALLLYGALGYTAYTNEGPAFVIASPSNGGYIRNYASARDVLAFYNVPMEIRESCASSCTIYLTLENLCIDGNASFIFHSSGNAKADEFMMNEYPEQIREWIEDRGGLTDDHLVMDFEEAKNHIRLCD